ncbi:hypothetical protein CON35_28885 [Bacillus cereus]|nr:hypothetical protein CON35_28885 [Bacillus cereus]
MEYKYQVQNVVILSVWMSQNVATTSLARLSSCLETFTEILISLERLNQRFTSAAAQLLQNIFAELLNKKLTLFMSIASPYTAIFKRIYTFLMFILIREVANIL